MSNDLHNKYTGTLVGLAVGDALGTTLEFVTPGTKPLLTEMSGGGVFRLEAGKWTDDTSMALCLSESLIESNGFNAKNQLTKYLKWYREGYLSSTGECFDIGNTTLVALNEFKIKGSEYCGSTNPLSAGNGSIMRLTPVVIVFHKNIFNLLEYSALSSKTTHAVVEAIQSCQILALYIKAAFENMPKSDILSHEYAIFIATNIHNISHKLQDVINGSYKTSNPPDIVASGYCVKTLEAALWAFYNTDSFEECLIKAVNLCNDSDTVGAVCGQIAGAYYGHSEIPDKWIIKLYKHDEIYKTAINLTKIKNK